MVGFTVVEAGVRVVGLRIGDGVQLTVLEVEELEPGLRSDLL